MQQPDQAIYDAERLADLAVALPDPVVVLDGFATVRWANPAAERLIGRSLSEYVGTNALGLVHPDDVTLAASALTTVQSKEVGSAIELRLSTASGWILVEVVGAPLDDGGLLLTLRDLTKRRMWEVAGDDTSRFRSIVHHSPGLTMLLSDDGIVQCASGAISRQLGRDPELVCGQPLIALVDPVDRALLTAVLSDVRGASTGQLASVEVRLLHVDDRAVPYELNIVSLVDDPTVQGLVVSGHDISRLRAAQQALEQLAAHDPLTGLGNRRTFETALDREWTLTSRDGIDSYVVVADLDGFKRLNDTYGHAAGDVALRMFADTLRDLARETDVVCRLGGDEFAVILVRCGGEAAAMGLQARLRDEVRQRSWPHGLELAVTTGYHSLRRSASPADALHRADVAMLAAKPVHLSSTER